MAVFWNASRSTFVVGTNILGYLAVSVFHDVTSQDTAIFIITVVIITYFT